MRKIIFVLFISLFILTTTSQSKPTIAERPNSLYTPDQILNSSKEVKLTKEQQKEIEKLEKQYSEESTYLNRKMDVLSKKFLKIINTDKINRTEAALILEEITALEKVAKVKALLYLIDVKNVLTKDQQKILSEKNI